MNERAQAARYARELLAVTYRQGLSDRVADEFEAIVEASRHFEGQRFPLFHPLVPKGKKVAAIRHFSETLGFSKPTTVILVALAEAELIYMLEPLAKAFRDRLNQKKGVVAATVTTAVPIAPDRIAAVAARLGEVTGRQIVAGARVDASLIGGVVTQVGSLVFDGSVTRQLARMRAKLVENA
jgi:F-type H+-transporting ATPase subunit delta